MTLEEIVSLIGTQGFAIAIAVVCLLNNFKNNERTTERLFKIEERSIDCIDKNTAVMEKLTTMIQVMVNGKPGE